MSKQEKVSKNICIGIDLGTTYSCVAVMIDDQVQVIPNDSGNRITPSYVSFTDDERLVGEAAKRQSYSNPTRTVYNIKRFIGRKMNELTEDVELVPYTIQSDENGCPMVLIKNNFTGKEQKIRPEQISAFILEKMKNIAEDYLGCVVNNAVVTVPAYFNDFQKQATINAAKIAGLNCLRIINEPTAACLCYGLNAHTEDQHVMVFDLGGGTLDVSIVNISNGVFDVKATSGDTHLGGEDFDHLISEYIIDQIHKKYDIDVSDNNKVMNKIRVASEKAKIDLSSRKQTNILIEGIGLNSGFAVDFEIGLSRNKFETLAMELFNRCLLPVTTALDDAKLTRDDISEIVLVGGSTRIPKIRELLGEHFNGKKLNHTVNPDEAVAYGAAVQGEILVNGTNSKVQDILLLDVNSLSLGVEAQKRMSVIIPKNSTLPIKGSRVYSTVEDNQTSVKIKIYEGERLYTVDNHLLGEFELTNIRMAPRGIPRIEVVFNINVDGVVEVSAVDKETGLSAQICISRESGRLSPEEIQRMIEDADKYRAADELKKESLNALNSFENYLSYVQKSINDKKYNHVLTDDEISYVNQYVLAAMEWVSNAVNDSTSANTREHITKDAIDRERMIIEDNIREIMYCLYSVMNHVYKDMELPHDTQQNVQHTGTNFVEELINEIQKD